MTRSLSANFTCWRPDEPLRLKTAPPAVARADEFKTRVKQAAGDVVRLADLMAEAIAMEREARGLERLTAYWCLDEARTAYLAARGNQATANTLSDRLK